jgi:hypothetical protein
MLGYPEERKCVSKLTSFMGNHRPLALIGGAVAVALAGIGAGIGVSHLGSSSPSSATATTASTTTSTINTSTTLALGAGRQRGAGHHGVRGQITAENGSTWTVLTKLGRSVSVDITPSTQFGTLASPASASSFPVGSEIAATGSRSGTVVTATRIFTPFNAAGDGGTTATTTAG